MNNSIAPEFWDPFSLYGNYVAMGIGGIGIIIILIHYLRLMTLSDLKARYEYISLNEVKRLWSGILLILVGLTLMVIILVHPSKWLWLFVSIFVGTMAAVILGVVIQNTLRFYYPFFIEKRLKKIRYTPRISPEGRKMKLLSEEEEDVHLDEGMQAEEDAFSVDYDVWVDEESGYTKIEKYYGRMHAAQCPNCNYQTLKVDREEVIQVATEDEEGELMKYFGCKYCGHKERKSFKIAKVKHDITA